jgi:hypothetical protein
LTDVLNFVVACLKTLRSGAKDRIVDIPSLANSKGKEMFNSFVDNIRNAFGSGQVSDPLLLSRDPIFSALAAIRKLRQEGLRLLELNKTSPNLQKYRVKAWLNSVNDTLLKALSANSDLYIEYKGFKDSVIPSESTAGELIAPLNLGPEDQSVQAVQNMNQAASIPYDAPRQATVDVEQVINPNSEPTEVFIGKFPISDLVSIANVFLDYAEAILQSQLTEQGFGHEIDRYIRATYTGSWWFRTPIFILIIAVGFAAFGVIQINDVKVDLDNIAATAIERSSRNINVQLEQITIDLATVAAIQVTRIANSANGYIETLDGIDSAFDATVEAEQNRINRSVDGYISTLESELAPQAQATLSWFSTSIAEAHATLDPIQQTINTLENRVPPLERGVEAIEQASQQGLLGQVSTVLNVSTLVLFVPFIGFLIVSLILIGVFVRRARR